MEDDDCCNMVADRTFANRQLITRRVGGAVVAGEKFLVHTLFAQDYRRRALAHDGDLADPEFAALRAQFGLPAAPIHGALALSMAQAVLPAITNTPVPREQPKPAAVKRAPKV